MTEQPRLRLKRNALHRSTRREVCDHVHVPWSGRMPCTGYLWCTMCGLRFDDREEIERDRAAARELILAGDSDPRVEELRRIDTAAGYIY